MYSSQLLNVFCRIIKEKIWDSVRSTINPMYKVNLTRWKLFSDKTCVKISTKGAMNSLSILRSTQHSTIGVSVLGASQMRSLYNHAKIWTFKGTLSFQMIRNGSKCAEGESQMPKTFCSIIFLRTHYNRPRPIPSSLVPG